MSKNKLAWMKTAKRSGFSLIETAIVIILVSLAMVPIIKTIGGENILTNAGSGNLSAVKGQSSRVVMAANAIMEKALAGDLKINGNQLNLISRNPNYVITTSRQRYLDGTNREYTEAIEYSWSIKNLSYRRNAAGNLVDWNGNVVSNNDDAVNILAKGNNMYQAVLNVYREGIYTPVLSLPTYLFRQDCSQAGVCNGTVGKVGVFFALDASANMAHQQAAPGFTTSYPVLWDNLTYAYNHNEMYRSPADYWGHWATPYMMNRYAIGYNNPPAMTSYGLPFKINDMFNNATLDLVWVKPTDDPSTPYRDDYFSDAPMNVSAGGSSLTFPGGCGSSGDPKFWEASHATTLAKLKPFFASDRYSTVIGYKNILEGDQNHNNGHSYQSYVQQKRQEVAKLCGWTGTRATLATAKTLRDSELSYYEMARNALMQALIELEEDPAVVQGIKIGFRLFGGDSNFYAYGPDGQLYDAVNPSTVENTTITEPRFVEARRNFLLVNRHPNNNTPGGWPAENHLSDSRYGMSLAQTIHSTASVLSNKEDLTERIMVLVTRGAQSASMWTVDNHTPLDPPSTVQQVYDTAQAVGDGNFVPTCYGGICTGKKTTIHAVSFAGGQTSFLRGVSDRTPNGITVSFEEPGDIDPIVRNIKWAVMKASLSQMGKRYGLDL